MDSKREHDILAVFPTDLGWMAIFGSGRVLKRLTLGHQSAEAARKTLEKAEARSLRLGNWNHALQRRLQAYADGKPDDFGDVALEPGPVRPFQRSVLRHCREIPFGKTWTYGQLAARAGHPRAARAVGNCMAANRLPIVIPCHRVVPAKGGLGGYSAPGATSLKRRLLDLESAAPPHRGARTH